MLGLMLALCMIMLVCSMGRLPVLLAASAYRLVENWALDTPTNEVFGRVSGVASDGDGNILVYRRDGGNIWTFAPTGKFLRAWGSNTAKRSHGIRVDRNGFVWTTDDQGHQVKKWTAGGKVLLTLGTYGVPGEGPTTFNGPTDVAVGATGDIFVADGYINSRVAKFTRDGKFVKAWGSKGGRPSQFQVPHSIVIDSRGRVLVADRKNQRVQLFDQDGNFLDEWKHFGEPVALDIKGDALYVADGSAPKVWIASAKDGKPITSIEGAENQHSLAVGAAGRVYVGSVRSQYLRMYARTK